jgi:Fe-S cluster assembly ATP-binding protein
MQLSGKLKKGGTMLRLENISWSVPERSDILRNINLSIPDRKLTVVTGPNGGGKTSLAKAIAGLLPNVQGKIYLNNQDISNLDVTQRARLGISYAFQQPVRFKGIKVKNLLNIAAGKELSFDELCDLLGKVGLCTVDYVDREVGASLSGGEIKRIEIASVLARGTELNIFDEPEAGIDIWSFNGLVSVFKKLKGEASLLVISHQQRILEIADDIIVIADGAIRTHGPKDEVLPQLLEGEITGHCPVGSSAAV